MKKISSLASYMLLAMGLLTTSCSNDESMETPNAEVTQQMTRSQAVDILRNMNFDHALSKEIHGCVTNSLASGRDEYVRLSELMSKETRSGGQSLFATRLINLFMDKYITRSIEAEDMLKELTNSDFIIYWPYSEDWDGEELPTLVAAPDNEDATEAYGTKITRDGYKLRCDTVLVDEDYAMKHPVWVINTKKEDPNVAYIPMSNGEDGDSDECLTTRAAGNPLYVWKMTRMKVTHQYDGLFNGGSEFDIQAVYPNLPGYAAISTKHRVNFSRKDIRKERWKDLDLLLNSNWREDQITNALIITEWDNGNPITIGTTVKSKLDDGSELSASIGVTITDDDDPIVQQTLDRDFVFQNSVYSFDSGKVTAVIPINVE